MTKLAIPVITADDGNLSGALKYAKAGLYVGPARAGSKNPGSVLGKDWQHKTSRDPQVIASWYAGTDHGVFLHAGRSGAIIFDVDNPDVLPAPIRQAIDQHKPPYQSTRHDHPGRGHYVFAVPEGRRLGNSLGELGNGWGELRGQNGVIIAAPSVHESANGRYQWLHTGPVPILPGYLASRLPEATEAADAATDAEVAAFLTKYRQADRPECLDVQLAAWQKKIAAGESRHGTVMGHIAGALKEAKAGLVDAKLAADTFQSVFEPAVMQQPVGPKQSKARTSAAARSEWDGILAWAVAQGMASNPAETIARAVREVPPAFTEIPRPQPSENPATITEVHDVFSNWLGAEYDLDALDIILSAAAVERLDGDPVWLHLLSGPGNTKTETVQALHGAGGHVTSTITSEGALLSATSTRERTKNATGGLLRKIGSRGLLIVKDVTSILSMNRDMRAQVLAALREIYDGRWERNVGTDGGKTLTWEGRIVLIGAVTSEYDRHHAVISAMGDRFALVRVDSGQGRMASGRQALRNVGAEVQMRAELSEVAGRLLNRLDGTGADLSEQVTEALLSVADLITLARTAVEKDYKGQVLEAHAPEAPTRFAKMLGQIVRGGLSLGLDLDHCMRLAFRVAHDSLNPMRLACLLDVAENPSTRTSEVTKRQQKPRETVDRYLQELHILSLLRVDQVGDGKGWIYTLSASVDPYAVAMLKSVTGKVSTPGYWNKEGKAPQEDAHADTDISGDGGDAPTCWQCGKGLIWPDEQERGTCSRCRPETNLFGEEATA